MSLKTRKVDERYMVCDGCDDEIPSTAKQDRDYFVVQVRVILNRRVGDVRSGMQRYEAQVDDGSIKKFHLHTDCIGSVKTKTLMSVFDNVEVED